MTLGAYPAQVAEYYERTVEPLLQDLIQGLPAILLTGPRATGKTTTASRFARTVVRLDQESEAAAFEVDPDAALRGLPEPVLLDEWQTVPGVLGAVKRAVDADSRPGRFLLTGSVTADLDASTWPGTGRVVRLPMYGLTVAEQLRKPHTPSFFGRLAEGDELSDPDDPPDLRGYVELALRGGFPDAAFAASDALREIWLESYLGQLLTRDARQVGGERDPVKLGSYFEAYALNSAGTVDEARLAEAAGIAHRTARAYDQLLTDLLVADRVPAWSTNRLKRLVRQPKRYLVDPGLLAAVLHADVDAVMRDGDLLGRTLDTFVAAQLRAQQPVDPTRPRLYHLRQADARREVDLLGELRGRQLVGVEVKAAATARRDSIKHLAWLRDAFGDRFTAGVVFHTGPRRYQLADKIIAAPIAALWS